MTGSGGPAGRRGEWFVVAQAAGIVLVLLGPRRLPGSSLGTFPFSRPALAVGAVLMLLGALLFVAGAATLGPNLSPWPRPLEDSELVRSGPYRLVRHPIYGGAALASFGWALLVHSWLTLLYAAALFLVLDLKARREERWLREKFPAYEEYRRQARKLVPFLY